MTEPTFDHELFIQVPGALVVYTSARRASGDGFGLNLADGWGAGDCLLGFCGRKPRGMGVCSGNWLVGRVEISWRGRTGLRLWAAVNVSSER